MSSVIETLRIVYVVDVKDHGTKKLLASERLVQKSLKQTTSSFAAQDVQARRSAATATQVAARRSAGFAREATAARGTADALRAVGRQEAVLKSLGPGAAAAQARLTAGHDRQTAALQRLTVAERAQATAMRARTRLAASAPAALGAGRAVGGGAGVGSLGAGAAGGISARAARAPVLAVGVGLGVAVAQTVKFDAAMRNVNSIAQLSEARFASLRA